MTNAPAATSALDVGWLGVGKLGLPMAGHLLRAGHRVRAYDPAPGNAERLQPGGARVAGSIAEACVGAQLVFSSLPDDSALEAAACGPGGALASMAPGALYVDTSTVSPAASMRVADRARERGVGYLRCAVSGNPVVAQAAQLTVFASGAKDDFERARPLLATFGAKVFHVGDAEQARTMKLVVNLMIAVSAGMLAEALALGEKGGLDWAQMLEVIGGSAVGSPMVNYKVPPLAARDYSSTFSCRQMAKDLDLILGAASLYGAPAPLAAQLRQTYSALIARGLGDDDYIATEKLAEELAGIEAPTKTP